MTTAKGPHRPVEDPKSLLTADGSERSSCTYRNTRQPACLQRLLYLYHAATATVLRLNIKVLWAFVPLGLAAAVFNMNSIVTSTFNFLAIIPLSVQVCRLSDKLSARSGDLLGALINAIFGNGVELIAGILAIVHRDTPFAQSVTLGSILCKILLVLGCCFFSAAWRQPILKLNTDVSGTLSSLMNVSAVALILPTAICSTFKASELEVSDKVILAFSRGAAMVLFALYIYLFDQQDTRTVHGWEADNNDISQQESQQGIEQDTATPNNFLTSSTALVGSTAGVILCLHFLLASIDKTSEAIHVRRTFIATILIPIASNASKCATLIGTSQSSRADFALGVIVGSILQIALCIIPVLVMLGWVVHQPTTLKFDEFPTILLFLAILLVNRLVQNGKYTYIHGLVLVGLYVVITIALFLHHDT